MLEGSHQFHAPNLNVIKDGIYEAVINEAVFTTNSPVFDVFRIHPNALLKLKIRLDIFNNRGCIKLITDKQPQIIQRMQIKTWKKENELWVGLYFNNCPLILRIYLHTSEVRIYRGSQEMDLKALINKFMKDDLEVEVAIINQEIALGFYSQTAYLLAPDEDRCIHAIFRNVLNTVRKSKREFDIKSA